MSAAHQGESFRFPVRVYWEDTDAGGIVFYANYLKFFERARTEWLRALGVQQSRLRDETGGMFIVSETSVRYLRSAMLDDELLVTARLESAGRASLIIAQQAFLLRRHGDAGGAEPATQTHEPASSPVLLSEGTIRIGWVEAATLKPGRIPAAILEKLKR